MSEVPTFQMHPNWLLLKIRRYAVKKLPPADESSQRNSDFLGKLAPPRPRWCKLSRSVFFSKGDQSQRLRNISDENEEKPKYEVASNLCHQIDSMVAKISVKKHSKYWETLPSGPINGRGQDPWYGRCRCRGSCRGWRGSSWGSTSSSSSLSSLSASMISSCCSLSVPSQKNIWRVIIFLITGRWTRCWGGKFNVAQTNSVYWSYWFIIDHIDHIGL